MMTKENNQKIQQKHMRMELTKENKRLNRNTCAWNEQRYSM